MTDLSIVPIYKSKYKVDSYICYTLTKETTW